MRTALFLVTFSLSGCAVGARAQEVGPSGAPQGRTAAALEKAVRKEAAALDKGPASEVFGALCRLGEQKTDRGAGRAGACAAARLDALTREILRAWLLRGLDASPPPKDLDERLSDKGKAWRAAIVAHAEAIALQSALRPGQVIRVGGKRRSIPPLLSGRYRLHPRRPPPEPQPQTDGELERALRLEASYLGGRDWNASPIFFVLLFRGQARAQKAIGLTAQQVAFVRRLEGIILDTERAWLLRDLGGRRPPRDLADRYFEPGVRAQASMVAHAEGIVLDGILAADQAENLRRAYWTWEGVESLNDPELARRLGISGSQHDALLDELGNWRERRDQISARISQIGSSPTVFGNAALQKELKNQRDAQFEATESPVWELLTRSQARTLARLLGREPRPSPPPRTKAKETGGKREPPA